jgi:DNA-directed RNA polymerase II subunit RPB2
MDSSIIWKLLDSYFQDNPQSLVRHHIESYNDFFKNGIFQIFKEKNPIQINSRFDENLQDYRSKCIMYLGGKDGSKIYFGKPVIYDDANSHYMFPNEARLRNMTYGMTIHYDIEIEFINILEAGEKPVAIGTEELEMHGGNGSDYSDEDAEDEHDKPSDKRGGDTDKIIGGSGKAPVRKNKRKKVALDLTAAETARFREATEKSLIAPNVQKQTSVLEKIYLGKFPIMLQSNYCVLSGLPRQMRHTMGECKNDTGGYFIIDGKEKTVISQEKFGDNMLYIRESGDDTYLYSAEIRSVSENVSKPIRTLSIKMMAPTKKFTFKNLVVNIPNVRKPVPLFIVFRALGIISDKHIITMCLLDLEKYDSMIDLFEPSVHDAGGILTQRNALEYIASLTKIKTTSNALAILADYFLPHIGEMNFIQKAYYLGYITFRLLSVYTGMEQPTDRDNFKYKRIELVGSLMYDLFREYYTIQQRQIQLAFESKLYYNQTIYEDNLYGLIHQNFKDVFSERVVEVGFKKAFKGNWGAQTHTKRIGIIQDLNRLSFNSALSHLRKTNLPLDASVKLVGPRVLHSTQWGLFDPIDTPDGGNIGIHKHLSISAYVTQGVSREPMIKWLREKADMRLIEECSPSILSNMTKIIINGLWAGVVSTPIESVEKIRLFRRNGLIPIYTSVTFNNRENTIYIYTDAGRICRPIFYRDSETQKLSFENDTIMRKLKESDFTWNELISGFNRKSDADFDPNHYKMYELYELYENINSETNPAKLKRFLDEKAVLDYIDTNESENALIAMNMEEIEKNKSKIYTHLEIHESLIFGMMSNLINFPENNPATRNSFSCGQSKQACSMYHTNHQVRMDKTAVVLVSGQTPLVKTRYLDYINNEENPYGENAIVAIMCYTGYNVEDAMLINEGALKRGLFRTTYYSTYESHEEKSKSSDSTTEQIFTNIESETNVIGTKPGYDYSKLDKYGLIRENTQIDEKTVLIGLTTSNSNAKDVKVDASKTPKKGQLGHVDKSFITDGEEGHRIAKIRIREERIPNLGDKMASRSGQKGTIGMVVPESDMPFTKDGIRPDIIINPHALPSRMTIGQLVECIIGKSSAMYGAFSDCTAFINKGSKVGVFGEMLTEVGYHSSGNEILYNGMTGDQIEAEIFMGPNYYMRLKHMVKDKINYRALGPRTALTRQPVAGRANDGGLRIGEMERDSVISHGASYFLKESMMERGDKYYMAVCNTTGMLAIYNPAKNLFMSPMADGPIKYVGSLDGKEMNIENVTKYGRNFSIICIPYSLKLLIQELQTINVQMRIITEDNIEQIENMSFSKNIEKLTQTAGITPKTVVNNILAAVKESGKIAINIKPESIAELTPEIYYPEGITPTSLEYPPYSPVYQETEEERAAYERAASNESSPYYPNTPLEEEPAGRINMESGEATYLPRTPSMSPTEQEGGGGAFANLSDAAQKFRQNEKVHYRGDLHPSRIWSIGHVGDKFIKIEPMTFEGLDAKDHIKIVTAFDIYPVADYMSNLPKLQMGGNGELQPSPYSSGEHYATGGMPSINFAPTIKVMNGGSDFSTEPIQAHQPQMGGTTINPIIESIPQMGGVTSSASKLSNEPDAAVGNGAIDFSKGGLKIVKKG